MGVVHVQHSSICFPCSQELGTSPICKEQQCKVVSVQFLVVALLFVFFVFFREVGVQVWMEDSLSVIYTYDPAIWNLAKAQKKTFRRLLVGLCASCCEIEFVACIQALNDGYKLDVLWRFLQTDLEFCVVPCYCTMLLGFSYTVQWPHGNFETLHFLVTGILQILFSTLSLWTI